MNPTRTNPNLRFVGEANFDSEVLHSNSNVLVAFWAPWSKPCHVIDPVLLEVAQACSGEIEVVKVNADDNPNLSMEFGVQHIPTVIFFDRGRLRGHLVGTVSKEAILNLVSRGRQSEREKSSSGKGATK